MWVADEGVSCGAQNLNKTLEDLDCELTLRPNNNDMSVMGIIQGRRMTLAQSKPGLVVVGLEEVPPVQADAEGPHAIDQLRTLKLLSDRFAGLKGSDTTAEQRARLQQQGRDGISNHATVLCVFTSNYTLSDAARSDLSLLPMFQNLTALTVTAVADHEREAFASGFLAQLLRDTLPRTATGPVDLTVDLKMELGRGDLRCLVRHLRTIGLFVGRALRKAQGGRAHVMVVHDRGQDRVMVSVDGHGHGRLEPVAALAFGTHENLFPAPSTFLHSTTQRVMAAVASRLASRPPQLLQELGHVVDYFYSGILAPAVVVSSSTELLKALVDALEGAGGVASVRGIDAGTYKIVKSLYEGPEVPCLREDLKSLRRVDSEALVVTEVRAPDADAQMRIREILEDTPSMVAFSTYRSALQKRGLFFAVHVPGTITPELRSRASIILSDA
jgi:hypothetical protein